MVSAVIPCRNERGHIEACVRSVLVQDDVPGSLEVIVVDGMSDDGTWEILQRLANQEPRVRIIENPAQIVSTGLNAAIRLARGSIIMRIDAHTEYAPDYIRQCVSALKERGADNVGGSMVCRGRSWLQKAIACAHHSPFSVGGARWHDAEYEGEVDTVPFGCWPRQVFDRIGFFDEELVRNQDDEFNLRLSRAGGRIWQSPRIKSWYTPRGSLAALFRQYLQYGYWKVPVMLKHHRPASIRHLVPGPFILALLILPLVGLVYHPFLLVWLALLAIYGLANLTASIATAARSGWRFLPALPLVFASYHFGYGIGFVYGIVEYFVLGRRPSPTFTKLTRVSS
jgi:succinoglycan biosynthesis protein ExoA